jgi:hypothetical protein
MKQFTGNEKAALFLAIFLFFGGASLVVFPQTGQVPHETRNLYASDASQAFDTLTPAKSRVLGIMAMALGVGLAAISFRGNT